jgi:hypothetical protein
MLRGARGVQQSVREVPNLIRAAGAAASGGTFN